MTQKEYAQRGCALMTTGKFAGRTGIVRDVTDERDP
jgi:hypothetical protein